MKLKKLIFGIALLFLMGCSGKNSLEDVQPNMVPKYSKTEYSGCFLEHGNRNLRLRADSIYYEERNDTLILNLILERNCAACLTDSLNIANDSVNIYITNSCFPSANCICDFEFKYYFTDYGDNVFFSVFINTAWEPEYILWNELTYP